MLRHYLRSSVLAASFAVFAGGCGPHLSDNDLGEKLSDLPTVDGADEPLSIPELDGTFAPQDESSDAEPKPPVATVPRPGE